MGLTNNDIFKKLRVANKLTNDDIIEICQLVDFKITKSELGAIFRREDHPKYMECGDQFLRNFLDGLIIHLRGPMPAKEGGTKKSTGKKSGYKSPKHNAHKKGVKKAKRPRVPKKKD